MPQQFTSRAVFLEPLVEHFVHSSLDGGRRVHEVLKEVWLTGAQKAGPVAQSAVQANPEHSSTVQKQLARTHGRSVLLFG